MKQDSTIIKKNNTLRKEQGKQRKTKHEKKIRARAIYLLLSVHHPLVRRGVERLVPQLGLQVGEREILLLETKSYFHLFNEFFR